MGNLSLRELCEGNLEGRYFTGDPERYGKAPEMDVCFRRGPAFGNTEGRFPSAFERRNKFLYLGEFL